MAVHLLRRLLPALALPFALGGCGLDMRSADLFLLQRTGAGAPLTLLVNDGGTVRCNGGKPRPLSDALLIRARDVADDLNKDAKAKLSVAAGAGSVARYRVRLQDGTISFPDTAGRTHPDLARAEALALDVAQGPCGLSG